MTCRWRVEPTSQFPTWWNLWSSAYDRLAWSCDFTELVFYCLIHACMLYSMYLKVCTAALCYVRLHIKYRIRIKWWYNPYFKAKAYFLSHSSKLQFYIVICSQYTVHHGMEHSTVQTTTLCIQKYTKNVQYSTLRWTHA